MDFPREMTIEDLFMCLFEAQRDEDKALTLATEHELQKRTCSTKWRNDYARWSSQTIVDDTSELAAAAEDSGELDPSLECEDILAIDERGRLYGPDGIPL